MTGIRKKNKILGFIFAVLAVWMVIFQNPSYAAQRGSLNIKTEQAGMTVYLYRVAEKQAGVYVLNEKFQASGADVSGGGSREAAITLTDFVKAQGIQPYRTGTGSGKHVVFRNLPDGEALYLVTGDPMTIGGKTYIPAPVLVEAAVPRRKQISSVILRNRKTRQTQRNPQTRRIHRIRPLRPVIMMTAMMTTGIRLRIRSRRSQQRLTRR